MAVYQEPGFEAIFVTCPFNRNHRVAERRFQIHVTHCPDSAPALMAKRGLKRCPYNLLHVYQASCEADHMKSCAEFAAALRGSVEARDARLQQQQKQQEQPPPQEQSAAASLVEKKPRFPSAVDPPSKRVSKEAVAVTVVTDAWNHASSASSSYSRFSSDASGPTTATGGAGCLLSVNQEEPDWWVKHCFAPDGSLLRQLGTLGLSRVPEADRKRYYRMLREATRIGDRKPGTNAGGDDGDRKEEQGPATGGEEATTVEEEIDWGAKHPISNRSSSIKTFGRQVTEWKDK